MEVIAIESKAFQKMELMYSEVCDKARELALDNQKLRTKTWLTAEEAATYVGYKVATLLLKKDDVGYSKPDGKYIMFRLVDLDAYMERGYMPPKTIKILKRA